MQAQVRAGFAAIVLALAVTSAAADDLTSYLPVQQGASWLYFDEFVDLDTGWQEADFDLSTIRGTDDLGGILTHRYGSYGELDPAGDPIGFSSIAWDDQGLQLYRVMERANLSEYLTETRAVDPQLMLPRDMAVGQTVDDAASFDILLPAKSGTTESVAAITFVGYEIIQTPAGIFDTGHIRSRRTAKGFTLQGVVASEATEEADQWLAPGVGIVREHYELHYSGVDGAYTFRNTRELLAAIVRGRIVGNPTYIDNIERVYIAYYGRPGDPDGMVYWTGRFAKDDGIWNEVIGPFAASQEAQDRFEGLDDEALLRNLYHQMFNRQPDDAGLAYYLNELSTGARTLERIMLDVLFGATGSDKDIIDHKVAVARHFTEQVNARDKAYGQDEIPIARDLLRLVTADPASVEYVKGLIDRWRDGEGLPFLEAEPNNGCSQAPHIWYDAPLLPFSIMGSLDSTPDAPDVDFYRVLAREGWPIQIDLEGAATGKGTLSHPYLGLFTSDCELLAAGDDIETLTARLYAMPRANDTYVLAVTSCCDEGFAGGGSGLYTLTVGVPTEGVSIAGRAVDAETLAPLSGEEPIHARVELRFENAFGAQSYNWYSPGADGTFFLDTDDTASHLLIPGRYELDLWATKYARSTSGPYDLAEGDALNLGDLPLTRKQLIGSISGRLIDAVRPSPLSGSAEPWATVSLARCEDWGCYSTLGQRPVDEHGHFRFESLGNLRPGIYEVAAAAQGYAPFTTEPFFVGDGEDVNLGDLPLTPLP